MRYSYRVKPDGTLMYRDMNYNWIVIPATSYCLDGFQYGTEDPIFSGGEEDYGVLMCGLPSSNNTVHTEDLIWCYVIPTI